MTAIWFDLFAQPVYVGLNGMSFHIAAITPNFMEHFLTTYGSTSQIQASEDVDLLVRQASAPPLAINNKLVGWSKGVWADCYDHIVVLFVLSNLGIQSGNQYSQAKGFGDVIAGTRFESADSIIIAVRACQ
jgi:hypothetical protein